MSMAQMAIFSVSLAAGDVAGIAGWAWLLIFLGISLVVALLLISNASFSAQSPYLEGLAHGEAHADRSGQVDIHAGQPETAPAPVAAVPAAAAAMPAEAVPIAAAMPPEVVPAAAAMPAAATSPENLEIIEGIGPKINQILHAAGITSFAQLAGSSVEHLNEVLHDAGLRVNDPSTWPDQARLAAAGKWPELEEMQSQLKGGRRS